jgi:isopentenyl-diphosphate delta-isomerase
VAPLISKRKDEHISICLKEEVGFRKKNGFEKYDFVHQALPELNLADIDTSTTFLGKPFTLPFFIEALTGGSSAAASINRNLAKAAASLGIGMGVGSQRAMLSHPSLTPTYCVRKTAPHILLLGNIGATQLCELKTGDIEAMVAAIEADGLAIHLNAAQEMCQPEGDRNWRDVLSNIQRICTEISFPVVVKETGCGIDEGTARRLSEAGVSALDVAGAGGTSFTKVEYYRGAQTSEALGEWGIPTAESLQQCRAAVSLPLIASGGIRNGVDCAKAIGLGASLVGCGLPLLKAANQSHHEVVRYLASMGEELKKVMLLVGARTISQLQRIRIQSRHTYSDS